MSELGYKISDLDVIPLTGKDCSWPGKIAIENTHFLGYAHTVFGTRYNKHNYRIPLSALRNDFTGYIGVETLNTKFTDSIKLWSGKWEDTFANKSYVKEWEPSENNTLYYNPDKFNDLDNSYFIIQDLPYPFEEGNTNNRDKGEKEAVIDEASGVITSVNLPIKATDPAPASHKIPTKGYIDTRLGSKRIVEVGTDFWVRDYDCTYVIRESDIKNASAIKIHYSPDFAERLLHNRIEFNVFIEGKQSGSEYISAASGKTITWMLYEGDTLLSNKLIWLGSPVNTAINEVIGNDEYYRNARYLKFRVETVTNHNTLVDGETITIDNNTIATKKAVADYTIYISCENLLYKGSNLGITIGSSDKSIRVTGSALGGYDIKGAPVVAGDNVSVTKLTNGNLISYKVSATIPDTTKIKSSDSSIAISGPTDGEWDLKAPALKASNNTITVTNPTTGDYSYKIKANIPTYVAGDNISIDGYTISANIPSAPTITNTNSYIAVSKNTSTNTVSIGFVPSTLYLIKENITSSSTLTIHELQNKIYYSTTNNLNLKLSLTNSTASNNAKKFTLIYSPSSDSTITINKTSGSKTLTTKWVMKDLPGTSPTFIAGRTYSITFTYVSTSTTAATIYGAIDWFSY